MLSLISIAFSLNYQSKLNQIVKRVHNSRELRNLHLARFIYVPIRHSMVMFENSEIRKSDGKLEKSIKDVASYVTIVH